MRTVDVRIRHDDDLMVAGFLNFEAMIPLIVPNAATNRGDHGSDFIVGKNFVDPRLFRIDQLTSQGKNSLGPAITTLLGGSTRGITLHDVKFTLIRFP